MNTRFYKELLGSISIILVTGCGTRSSAPPQAVPVARVPEKPPAWHAPVPVDLKETADPKVAEAVEAARRRVEAEPDSPLAVARLGHVYLAHGWDADAAQCYRRATVLDPYEYRWFYYLGRSLIGENPAESTEAFQECIRINSLYAPALLFHARALRQVGKNDAAEKRFSEVIELNPNEPLALQGLGEIELARGELEPAKKHLSRAVAINPGQKAAHAALARLYMTLGDRASAQRHAGEAEKPGRTQVMVDPLWGEVQNAGATSDWHAVRGAVLLRERRFEAAIEELEQAVSDDQDDARFWLNYGACLVHLKRYRDAMTALDRALAVRPHHKEKPLTDDLRCQVHVNRGVATAQLGDLETAKSSFEQALKLDPTSVESSNNLAILLFKQGKFNEAIAVETELLARRPNPKSARILQLLRDEQAKRPTTGGDPPTAKPKS